MTEKPKAKPKDKPVTQKQRFIEAARQIGADERPDALEKAFSKVKVRNKSRDSA